MQRPHPKHPSIRGYAFTPYLQSWLFIPLWLLFALAEDKVCVYIERSLSFTGLILQINLRTMPMCCSRLCLLSLLFSLSPAVTQACSPGHTHWLLLEMRDFPIYTVCVCVCVLFLKSVPPGHLILFYDSPPRFVLPLKSLLYCTDDSII